jgi:phosphomannomutase/phosphoglucomutase
MAKMLEIIALKGPLSELLKEVPCRSLDKRKLPCPDDKKGWVLEQVEAYFADRRTDLTDGVKVYFEEGWSLMRPSGTEPIFRIYSEGKDEATAKRCGDECEKVVRELLEE